MIAIPGARDAVVASNPCPLRRDEREGIDPADDRQSIGERRPAAVLHRDLLLQRNGFAEGRPVLLVVRQPATGDAVSIIVIDGSSCRIDVTVGTRPGQFRSSV
jgi:hypothetical protein